MQVVSAQLVSGKKVLLRYDLDVPLRHPSMELRTGAQGKLAVEDDFRLKAGMETLKLCLENAQEVTILGHLGRPGGEDPKYSIAPIYNWLKNNGFQQELESGKLKLLENLRFEKGEDEADLGYAKELATYGNFYVNEAFGAYHKAASTTVLPTLLPHAAGLHFTKEVEKLTKVRENPHHPLVVIIGGAKVEDKISFIQEISKLADQVLVGGKIAQELEGPVASQPHPMSSLVTTSLRALDGAPRSAPPSNILVAKLTSDGLDITEETVNSWRDIIKNAGMIVWNGPLGKVDPSGLSTLSGVEGLRTGDLGSAKGTYEIAQAISESWAEVIIGGGDTVGFLGKVGLLEKLEHQAFISVGGGAMLEFLSQGTLPTIKVLG